MVCQEFIDFFKNKMLEAASLNDKASNDSLIHAEKLAMAREVLKKMGETFPEFVKEFMQSQSNSENSTCSTQVGDQTDDQTTA